MGRFRADQYEITVDGPEASFGSASGLFAGSELTGVVWGLSGLDSIDSELLEDQRYRIGGGSHEQIEGLPYKRIGVSFSTYCEGLGGTGAGDTEAAVANFVTRCLQGCLGSAGDLTTGAVATGTPTTTEVIEDSAGEHAVTASTIGLALIELPDGTYQWAPYTYATATMTLLLALSAAPDAAAVVHGGAVIPFAWRWSGGIGYSLTQRIVNADGGATTDYTLLGSFGSFAIPETGADGVPQLDFSWQAGGFTDLADLTAGTPASTPGSVLAGVDVAIAAFGATAAERPCVERIAFDLGADYEWSPCARRANPLGVSGADRASGTPSLRVTVLTDAAPPGAITSGESHYRESRRAKGDRYHVLVGLGQGGPGRSFALYMPDAILYDVQQTTVDNRLAQVLEFRPRAGSTLPQVIVAQS